MARFKRGDAVLVFKNPAFFDGGCGVVTEVNTETGDILYEVKDVTEDDRFMWVKEEFLMKIIFDKPTFWQKVKWFFGRI